MPKKQTPKEGDVADFQDPETRVSSISEMDETPDSPQKRQKVQTGVSTLDSLFEGGLPQSANVLLYGEPMCGKKLLLMQYVYEGLKSQIPGIFILTDFGYTEWKLKMQKLNMDLTPFEKSGHLQVVDCYSKQFEPSLQNTQSVRFAQNPAALSNISLLISEVQDSFLENGFKSHRLSLHSLSSLLEESNTKDFYKFLQFHVGKFRKNGATSLFTMEKGMHDSKDVIMVEHLMDNMVEFEDGKIRAKGFAAPKEKKRYKMGDYANYAVTSNGVELK